jgi:uncharacterized membrane protein YeaQ/YmgE (transglycosylase-associated protein family)
MGIIITIIIGFLAGLVAKWIHPGRENMGFILTTLLGIAGSFVAGYLGQFLGLYAAGTVPGFIASVIGALILLWIYGMIQKKS